jgi:hypothetical protein
MKSLALTSAPSLDEEARRLDPVAVRGGEQRRAPALIAGVDPGPAGEELLHHKELTALRRRDHVALVLIGLLGLQRSTKGDQPKEKGGRSRPCNS